MDGKLNSSNGTHVTNHATVDGLTAKQAEEIFNTTENPVPKEKGGILMDYVKNTLILKEERYFTDMDNEHPFDEDIVGLMQTDDVVGFTGKVRTIKELDYIYLYMDIGDDDFVFSEGIVIKNPYPSKPYKWCCKLLRPIEYMSDYLGLLSKGRQNDKIK